MNVGDLVIVKLRPGRAHRQPRRSIPTKKPLVLGLIVDVLERGDGWCDFEVEVEGVCEWFSDLELEVIHDQL